MPSLLQNYKGEKSDVIAILAMLDHLKEKSPDVAKYILSELRDQRDSLKLIASENYSSLSVQLAMGNWLTDKYAEGYPYHRFYAGCENVDAIEMHATKLANDLFKTESAYVQPHSGADANLVALYSVLVQRVQSKFLERLARKSVDELSKEEHETLRKEFFTHKMMGLSLSSGGHLTHGYRHNISSKLFQSIPFDVDPKTHLLNYDAIRETAKKEKPLVLLIGYSAYTREIDFERMKSIADEVGAVLIVDMAHFAGLVAGGVFKGSANPAPYADILTSTTHKTLRGPRGGLVLSKKEFADTINRGCPYVLGGPLPHVIAAKAIAFQEALSPSFSAYAKEVASNAKALAEALKAEGIKLITGGTDNHIVLIDLTPLQLTGRQAETLLREAKITVNRNMIPFDPQGPWYTSGIRIGTPAMTTLGMKAKEMKVIARLIASILKSIEKVPDEKSGGYSRAKGKVDSKIMDRVKGEVAELRSSFPLYPELPLEI